MFQDALNQIIAKLEQAKSQELLQDFGLIGGLAIAAWGTPRATQDIDFAIALGGAQPLALANFLGGTYEAGDQDDPLRGVFRVQSTGDTHQIPIQLVMLPSVWSPVLFSEVQKLELAHTLIPIVSWQALLLLKLYAGGPKDMLDAHTLFTHQQSQPLAQEHVTTMAQKVGLMKEWNAFVKEITDRKI
ncbi:MAG: hypothetical protein OEZ57_10140 [Nitrospirota bacterium]|nr:hypothetical protein [Nitrospirota bacterium]MDH5587529.1 hypothetical protein [Nitrospirota bacterium]MDH5775259.1 hypothetical protein [Nitrospirota bacterium]